MLNHSIRLTNFDFVYLWRIYAKFLCLFSDKKEEDNFGLLGKKKNQLLKEVFNHRTGSERNNSILGLDKSKFCFENGFWASSWRKVVYKIFFWTNNFFSKYAVSTKNSVGQEFSSAHNFCSQLVRSNFFDKQFFWPQTFWTQKYGLHTFYGPEKMCIQIF